MNYLETFKIFIFSFLAFLAPFLIFAFLYTTDIAEIEYHNHTLHSVLLLLILAISSYVFYLSRKIYEKTRETNLFILSLSFFTFGFFFLIHATSTPETLFFTEAIFEISEHLGTLLGALILLGFVFPSRPISDRLYKNRNKILVTYATLLTFGLIALMLLPEVAVRVAHTMDIFVALATALLFAFIAVFLSTQYGRVKNAFLFYLIMGISILINTGIIPVFYSEWNILWWYFHIVLLSGFGLIFIGLVRGGDLAATFEESRFYTRISTRVSFIIVLGVILFSIMSFMSYSSSREVSDAFVHVNEFREEVHIVSDTGLAWGEVLVCLNKYVFSNEDETATEKENVRLSIEKINFLLDKLDKISINFEEERPLYFEILKNHTEAVQKVEDLFEARSDDDTPLVQSETTLKEIGVIIGNIMETVDRWHSITDEEVAETEHTFNVLQEKTSTINYSITVFFVIYILLSGLAVLRWTIKPTKELTDITKKIASGETSLRAPVTTNDEIGTLAQSFNKMTEGFVDANKKFRESNLKLTIKIMEEEELSKNLKDTKDAMLNVLDDLKKEKENVEQEAQNAQKFQQAVESSSDAIMITDTEANIIHVNTAWEKLNGYTGEEVLGKNPRILQSGKTSKEIYKDMWDTLTKGKSFDTEEIINKRKDGTEYSERISISPVSIDDKAVFYIGISQDITKRKEVDKMKSEFITVASHQLRTPLTSIRWVIELFLKKETLSKQGKEYLHDVHTSAQKLSDLVDLLLNVSRIEEGKVGVLPQPVELVNFISDFIEESRPLLDKKNIDINFKHPDKLEVTTDESAVRNIIQSVVSNAIEYTLTDGKIGITLEKNEHEFYLNISDTGIGIPKSEQENIAKKFTRGSNAMLIKTDGTGMGLYIAYRAIELLGGKIRFESEENKGTTFFITLPIESKPIEGESKLV